MISSFDKEIFFLNHDFLTVFTHKDMSAFKFHERYRISSIDVKYNQFNGVRLMSLAETWSWSATRIDNAKQIEKKFWAIKFNQPLTFKFLELKSMKTQKKRRKYIRKNFKMKTSFNLIKNKQCAKDYLYPWVTCEIMRPTHRIRIKFINKLL